MELLQKYQIYQSMKDDIAEIIDYPAELQDDVEYFADTKWVLDGTEFILVFGGGNTN